MRVHAELVYLGEKQITKKDGEEIKLPVFVCPIDKEQIIPFADDVTRAKISKLPEYEKVKMSLNISEYQGKIRYNINELTAQQKQATATTS